ncbi:MAG: dipeptide/oligopeptide/nickel ABC transporter ATP-binding protein [Planctomycetes bacterium]|nr:dipeptide/oligopeptide/nickel ABC transporter ATP-binding protein [Planctomycetota bacterium]
MTFELMPGETFALVGASGCGKTSIGRALLGLESISGGSALLHDPNGRGFIELAELEPAAWNKVRRSISMVFQDSALALDVKMSVGESVAEGLPFDQRRDPKETQRRVRDLFLQVGLDPSRANELSSQFSGGQRQRICIARSLALSPKLLICDEILSSLDGLARRRILDLLGRLQRETGLSLLFMTHDLSVLPGFAHRVAVMDGGRIVEMGRTEEFFESPQSQAGRNLLRAIPVF